jgi:hypothetical protein
VRVRTGWDCVLSNFQAQLPGLNLAW